MLSRRRSRLRAKIFLRDFLSGKKAMALRAVFDERRFETRLYRVIRPL